MNLDRSDSRFESSQQTLDRLSNHKNRRSVSILNLESSCKVDTNALFDSLMSDPTKRLMLLKTLEQEKHNIEKYKKVEKQKEKAKLKELKKQKLLYCESPTSLLRRRALLKNESCENDNSTKPAIIVTPIKEKRPLNKLLNGVIAFVDVRCQGQNKSAAAIACMQSMGATVKMNFSKDVTHVIFKEGSFTTYQRAKLMKINLVSLSWLEAIRKQGIRLPENDFPALGTEIYDASISYIFQEYDGTLDKERRQSSNRKSRRKTALPYELTKHLKVNESCNVHNTPILTKNIIAGSQPIEKVSVISLNDVSVLNKCTKDNSLQSNDSTPDIIIDNSNFNQSSSSNKTNLMNGYVSQRKNGLDNIKISTNFANDCGSIIENSLLFNTPKLKDNLKEVDMEITRNVSMYSSNQTSNDQNFDSQDYNINKLHVEKIKSSALNVSHSSKKNTEHFSTSNAITSLRFSPDSKTSQSKASEDTQPNVQILQNHLIFPQQNNNSLTNEDDEDLISLHLSEDSNTSIKNYFNSDEKNVVDVCTKGTHSNELANQAPKRIYRKLYNVNEIFGHETFNHFDVTKTKETTIPTSSLLGTGSIMNILNKVQISSKKLSKNVTKTRSSTKKVPLNTNTSSTNKIMKKINKIAVEKKKNSKSKTVCKKYELNLKEVPVKSTQPKISDCILTNSDPFQNYNESIKPYVNRRSSFDFVQSQSVKVKKNLTQQMNQTRNIVCTRMHKPEIYNFSKIVKYLEGFNVENQVSEKTTHLVVGDCKRTINLLKAIARGCWILKNEWLIHSFKTGKWLDEEEYELTDFSTTIQQCRLQRQAFGLHYVMDIFLNCGPIYVSKNSTPKRSDLEDLIKLCHGTITKIPRSATIIVGEKNNFNVTCVNEKWVLDCITYNKMKSFKKYAVIY